MIAQSTTVPLMGAVVVFKYILACKGKAGKVLAALEKTVFNFSLYGHGLRLSEFSHDRASGHKLVHLDVIALSILGDVSIGIELVSEAVFYAFLSNELFFVYPFRADENVAYR